MKIKLVCVGKLRNRAVQELVDSYVAKICRYYPFEMTVIPDVRCGATDVNRQKQLEGAKILADLLTEDLVVLFDERGTEYTSRAFARLIDNMYTSGSKRLALVIGGPYGFAESVYTRANMQLSLSKMTLPHELARLFAVEQLYRAGTIRRGEPYHHD